MHRRLTSLLVAIIATMSMTGCALLEVNSGSIDSGIDSGSMDGSGIDSGIDSGSMDDSNKVENTQTKEVETIQEVKTADEMEVVYMGNQRQRAIKMLNLLENTSQSDKNIMISPLSIEIALSLIGNGLGQNGVTVVEKYLGQPLNSINESNEDYIRGKNLGAELKIANSIWVKESLQGSLNKAFEESMQKHYLAEIDTFNSEVKPINNWVAKNTNGMITEIIDDIDPDLKAILINAIYFKGIWKDTFNSEHTTKGQFKGFGNSVTECDYMVGKVDTYLENTQATGFIKEYNNGYSFVGILPKEDVLDLDTFNIDTLLETKSTNYEVNIKMPKFESEYSTSLKYTLKKLGLNEIFEVNGISGVFEGDTDFELSDVIHKTAIKVNEEGTEASAVTAGLIRGVSVTPMKNVYLDRPFIYAIMDTETNSILFIGSMYNPSK